MRGQDRGSDGLTRQERYRLKDLDEYRKRKREWARTPEQRAKRRAWQAAWREKNRERNNELARQSHHRNKHKHVRWRAEYNLKKKYGIDWGKFEEILSKQGGRCLICGTDKPKGRGKRLHVDHDHKTGVMRGLLCLVCNTNLGWFEANREKILAYLQK